MAGHPPGVVSGGWGPLGGGLLGGSLTGRTGFFVGKTFGDSRFSSIGISALFDCR